eukprot:3967490-Prymnesium_polylepis.1
MFACDLRGGARARRGLLYCAGPGSQYAGRCHAPCCASFAALRLVERSAVPRPTCARGAYCARWRRLRVQEPRGRRTLVVCRVARSGAQRLG